MGDPSDSDGCLMVLVKGKFGHGSQVGCSRELHPVIGTDLANKHVWACSVAYTQSWKVSASSRMGKACQFESLCSAVRPPSASVGQSVT